MSFIKVTDPRKREALIKDFIETRKRIKDNFVAKKVGEIEYQRGLTKLFKPVTETQKTTAKEITEAQKATAEKFTSELLPIKEGISGLTTAIKQLPITSIETEEEDILPIEMEKEAITFPAYPNVRMTEKEKTNLRPMAIKFLSYPFSNENIDVLFGLNNKNTEKRFKIGDKFVTFDGNDVIVGGNKYEGTPGFWSLIVSKNPGPDDYTVDDLEKYKHLLIQTNAIYVGNNPTQNRAKGNYQGPKWKNIIEPIWKDIKPKTTGKGGKGGKGRKKRQEDPTPSTSGTGLTILPNDPNALIERFDLLLASQNAGHTGVRNELVSIFDELKRQGVINTNTYKILNSIIKK